ncbi:acetyl-CoA carboxylase carboxyltransferase subunit alpha [Butyrivibrio sp. VCD2006]|uniref:acetyl-CoA carboxylase carboxyltransferase subunit alpha n=1 Tax=Butyrivibrio sp. VCD2006 TaxID=1280664 RepID=UPI00047938F4|nr:acetyl-CoA carboxylase carboxyltransferase subunit alpha [Butyrivibrio sp. VCD2006]
MLEKVLKEVEKLDERIAALEKKATGVTDKLVKKAFKSKDVLEELEDDYEDWSTKENEIDKLRRMRDSFLSDCENIAPDEKVFLARHPKRPHIDDFIEGLFTDFFEQKGDHLFDEDKSIYGGIARFHGIPVTVLGHKKGHTMEENMEYNFGMPCPEGYRKALRIMNQAEKFGRPIITFIDTPGAYPGLEAEEHGQGEAIAMNLAKMSQYHVPVISVVTGEGNSGGALAIGVANKVLMLENAVYSILSPEGFASILWKDAERHKEACKLMKLTADDLYEAGVADEIVKEPIGGAQRNYDEVFKNLDKVLYANLKELMTLSPSGCKRQRLDKYRKIG